MLVAKLSLLLAPFLAIGFFVAGEPLGGRSSANAPYSLVVVTEDYASDTPGCDAISVFDTTDGSAVHRGGMKISPGRLAASDDLSLLVATQSNSSVIVEYEYQSFVYVAERSGLSYEWSTAALLGGDVATFGGIAVLSEDRSVLVATSNKADNDGWLVNRAPFQVRKYRLPQTIRDLMRIGPSVGRFTTNAPALEILLSPDAELAHIVTSKPAVHTIDVATLLEIGAPISIPPLEGLRIDWHGEPLSYWHATLSPEGTHLVTNRGRSPEIAVVDLVARSAITRALAADIQLAGGVAFSEGPNHTGLLAVHGLDKVAVYDLDPGFGLREIGRAPVKPPDLELDDKWCCTGPHLSIAWSTDGTQIIAATSDETSEFAVFDVTQGGESLVLRELLSACAFDTNLPNDIVTAKWMPIPSPSPQAPTLTPASTVNPSSTATPSLGPTVTLTPSVASTNLPTATDTATHKRDRLWLPLVHTEEPDSPD